MLDKARQTLRMEAQAIERLAVQLDSTFEAAIHLLLSCKGRVVVTGMGKSGLVGQKIELCSDNIISRFGTSFILTNL